MREGNGFKVDGGARFRLPQPTLSGHSTCDLRMPNSQGLSFQILVGVALDTHRLVQGASLGLDGFGDCTENQRKRPLWAPLIFQMLLSRALNSHGKSSWMRLIL